MAVPAPRASARTLTIAEAADELGVAPARVRALVSSGALGAGAAEGTVSGAGVAELARRNVVRSIDVAALEGAVDRALRRRLPGLLEGSLGSALEPVATEVAVALADVQISTERMVEAEQRARVAEEELATARARVAALEAQVAELEARSLAGLFRRRRSSGVATA